jgi:hypothetical protein
VRLDTRHCFRLFLITWRLPGSNAAGRKSPHDHAQTGRNLKRTLRNAAASARLIQADGLDSESSAELVAALDGALEELHRLQRSLDRRIRRDRGCRAGAASQAPSRAPGDVYPE